VNVNCVQASAPGKLLLIGEYAVLDGAPALVMAVDRRVKVRLQRALSGTGWLSAVQLGFERASMRVEGDVLRCDGVDSSVLGLTGRLIPGIMRALGRSPGEIATVNVEINSGALFESDHNQLIKLGLGSSAAVCAALAVALTEWFEGTAGPADPRARLRRWLPVYRESLGARASGADLAAAFCGGISEFRSTDEHAICTPTNWPEDLHWRAIWTRQAAQTTDFVGAFDTWKLADPVGAGRIRSRLDEIARHAVANAHDGAVLCSACAAYAVEMVALGDAMGKEVVTAPHRRLAEHGRECGVVYKSCGAGGGDLGIALARDPEKLRAFEFGASDCGGVPLNLAMSECGAEAARRQVSESGKNLNKE
jgi:phosphomevalonate kinase